MVVRVWVQISEVLTKVPLALLVLQVMLLFKHSMQTVVKPHAHIC